MLLYYVTNSESTFLRLPPTKLSWSPRTHRPPHAMPRLLTATHEGSPSSEKAPVTVEKIHDQMQVCQNLHPIITPTSAAVEAFECGVGVSPLTCADRTPLHHVSPALWPFSPCFLGSQCSRHSRTKPSWPAARVWAATASAPVRSAARHTTSANPTTADCRSTQPHVPAVFPESLCSCS